MFELKVVPRVRDVPKEAWDALIGENDSPFVEHTWLDCLEEAGCVGRGSGWLPCHFTLYRDEKLVAVAPAYLKGNSEGEFVFDWSWADLATRVGTSYYPKLVFAVPFTPAAGARVLTSADIDRNEAIRGMSIAAQQLLPELEASSAHVLFPREEEAAAWADNGYLRRYGVQFQFTNPGYENVEDFLKTLPSKKRTQLRREMKQPAKDGVEIRTLTKDEYADPLVVRDMFRFYVATVDKFMWGRRYLNEKFFRLVAEHFSDRLAWVIAKKDGRAIAGAFNVKKNKILYGRYWGTEVDLPFLHFNVCYYHGIQDCIAGRLERFEPGAGGEHKRVRGFRPTLTNSVHFIRDARMKKILTAHLEQEREHLRQYVEHGGGDDDV